MAAKELALPVWSATLAAKFAQECKLPPGNLWEPPVARHLARLVEAGQDRDSVEMVFALQLGLGRRRARRTA